MKATAFEFRVRFWITVPIYLLLTAAMLILFAVVLYKRWPLARSTSLSKLEDWKNSGAPVPAELR